ncbi:hypothetical protein PGT21_008303 [Puccinia graminis f. sp. tritici]|uniref:ZNF598/HEL2 PAH domain-containing protein n=1 Tax=Puccinia graminis f. sp. tritici TaxID=56615 RepID=A0A5B0LV03_PUCGR|nr:hypothetical protein PGT21_008303 [Puccinia graminis f. sp. tritici]
MHSNRRQQQQQTRETAGRGIAVMDIPPISGEGSTTLSNANRIVPGLAPNPGRSNSSKPHKGKSKSAPTTEVEESSHQSSSNLENVNEGGSRSSTQYDLQRHAVLMQRVSEAVNGAEAKTTSFKVAVRTYRNNEMAAPDFIDTLCNIFDHRSEKSADPQAQIELPIIQSFWGGFGVAPDLFVDPSATALFEVGRQIRQSQSSGGPRPGAQIKSGANKSTPWASGSSTTPSSHNIHQASAVKDTARPGAPKAATPGPRAVGCPERTFSQLADKAIAPAKARWKPSPNGTTSGTSSGAQWVAQVQSNGRLSNWNGQRSRRSRDHEHGSIPGTHDAATWNYTQATQDYLEPVTGKLPPAIAFQCQVT